MSSSYARRSANYLQHNRQINNITSVCNPDAGSPDEHRVVSGPAAPITRDVINMKTQEIILRLVGCAVSAPSFVIGGLAAAACYSDYRYNTGLMGAWRVFEQFALSALVFVAATVSIIVCVVARRITVTRVMIVVLVNTALALAFFVLMFGRPGFGEHSVQPDTRGAPPWGATTRPKTLAYDPGSGIPSAVAYRLEDQVWEEQSKDHWVDVTRQFLDEDRKKANPPSHLSSPMRQYIIWGEESTVRAIVCELLPRLRSSDPRQLRAVLRLDGYGLDDPVLDAAEEVLSKPDLPEIQWGDELVLLSLWIHKLNDPSSITVDLGLAAGVTSDGRYWAAGATEALVVRFTNASKAVKPRNNVEVSVRHSMQDFLGSYIGTCNVGGGRTRDFTETPVGTFPGKWKDSEFSTTTRDFIAPNIGRVDRQNKNLSPHFDNRPGRILVGRTVVDRLVLRLKDKVVVKKSNSKKD